MITRIVRMEFAPEKGEDFLALFNAIKQRIRHFPGVQVFELHRDAHQTNGFYTYSIWRNADDLEAYRKSDVFRSIWPDTKKMFTAQPQAFSLKKEMVVD